MCRKPGCEKPIRARGYCINHYSAFREREKIAEGNRRIDLRREQFTKEELEDFWQFVKKELNLV